MLIQVGVVALSCLLLFWGIGLGMYGKNNKLLIMEVL